MAGKPERVNPLAGVQERQVVTAQPPKPVPPSQAKTKNATGRVLIAEYTALREWAAAHDSSVNAVVGALVRQLLGDKKLQAAVAAMLGAAQETEKAARVAELLEDEKVRARVRELLAESGDELGL